ncbi:MAG TPA: universal stress protein, partial [Tepidiformaceae bacterium]|nr:universal stress protein [Tepidiformaceae bacterium]
EVVRADGGTAGRPGSIGLMGHEVRSAGADPVMTEDRSQAMERAKMEHSDYLRAVAGHYLSGHAVTYDVAFAHDPADAIAEQARDLKADMIALGSHGRSGVNRAIMGSVAEKLMRHASTPVLVIGPTAREAMPPHAPQV